MTSEALKRKAKELGFDLCGVAPADAYPELSFLEEWLARGYAGEMAWMARTRERRADVRNVLPDARSVIVTATLYNTDRPYGDELPPDIARVSRYAWGDDYHDVLKPRLDALAARVKGSLGAGQVKTYVDTFNQLKLAMATAQPHRRK